MHEVVNAKKLSMEEQVSRDGRGNTDTDVEDGQEGK